jgi:selenocysteine lyase/cysteine desulfurase
VIPYWVVEARARDAGIALRGGCFCNPGASEAALRLDPRRTGECLETLADEFTPERFASCSGSPVGAVRVSVGLANDDRDIRAAVDFFASFRE